MGTSVDAAIAQAARQPDALVDVIGQLAETRDLMRVGMVVQLVFILPHLAMRLINRVPSGSRWVPQILAIDEKHAQRLRELHWSLVDRV